MTFCDSVGKRIRARRLELSLTQDDLARKIGYKNKATISRIEADTRDITPSILKRIADALLVTPAYLMGWADEVDKKADSVRIPVYGRVAAGIPLEAITDIEDYEEIPAAMAAQGDYLALTIRGDSMEPRIKDGDVVIVRKQEDVADGEIGVVLVNGEDAVCKKIKKTPEGVMLISNNPKYDPLYFTAAEVISLPVTVLGKVVELRAKF